MSKLKEQTITVKVNKSFKTPKATSYIPLPTHEECKQHFVKSLPKKDDGSNSLVGIFLACMDVILHSRRSFTIDDLTIQAKVYFEDLPIKELKELFDKYVEELIRFGRLEELAETCYDKKTYLIV